MPKLVNEHPITLTQYELAVTCWQYTTNLAIDNFAANIQHAATIDYLLTIYNMPQLANKLGGFEIQVTWQVITLLPIYNIPQRLMNC